MDKKEKLLKIKKRQDWGVIGELYRSAKETQDPILIREVNKIIRKNQNKRANS